MSASLNLRGFYFDETGLDCVYFHGSNLGPALGQKEVAFATITHHMVLIGS
jgi:hypothetical protein